MKIKDRYIAKTLLTYSLVVLLVWLSIYSFFNFLDELNRVGTFDYTILKAFTYVLLQMPEVAYDHASPVILLGCVLGMGHLATTSQLLVLRVSGISKIKITWITIKNSFSFILFLIIIGETIAPVLTEYAENERSNALGQNNLVGDQEGYWIRDGDNFINVEKNIDGNLLSGITVIEVDKSNNISNIIKSESAIFDGKSLNLDETNIFTINALNEFENISFKGLDSYNQIVTFDQDLIDGLEKEPKDLSTYTIIKQIQFLKDNKLRAGVFEVELYNRLVKPLSLVAMILLGMLFIFGSSRDATLGRKIFFGVTIGLSFELISRIGGATALSFEYSPLLSSFAPPLVVIVIAISILMNKSIY
jgi:lipopolysaccharide export system permease protein